MVRWIGILRHLGPAAALCLALSFVPSVGASGDESYAAGGSTIPRVGAGDSGEEEGKEEEEGEDGEDEEESGGTDEPEDPPPAKPPEPPKPAVRELPGLLKGQTKFEFKEEPYMRMVLPKKGDLQDQWVFVDIEARIDGLIAPLEEELKAEKAKSPQDSVKVEAIQNRIDGVRRDHNYRKIQLESKDQKQFILVWVETATKDMKIAEASVRDALKQQWDIKTTVFDGETTTKGMKSKNRFSYRYELLGTPKSGDGKQLWSRFETTLIYNKKSTTRYRITYRHSAHLEVFEGREKEFLTTAELLQQAFDILQ